MISVRSILIDVDASAADHPALQQAVNLAARCGARLKIVDVLPWVPGNARQFVTADIENDLVEIRRERLAAIADAVKQVSVTTEVLRGRPATSLIQDVFRFGHDLVIRSHGRDPSAGPRSFGAIDMELLRQCPCPVWIVGPASWHRPWRILAAVHANPGDATEQTLNETIIEWALTLEALGEAHLTVLQAWTAYGASLLRSRMSADDFAAYVDAARRSDGDALTQFLKPLTDGLANVAVELVHGEPEDAIVHYVESHGIDVVVMGTVARTGVAGLVMGNTAERVLRRLHGSVLAVKPPGFQAPAGRIAGER